MVTNRPILDRAHAGAAARRAVRTPMRLRPAAEAVPTEVTSDEGRGKLQLMDLEGDGELATSGGSKRSVTVRLRRYSSTRSRSKS